MIGKTNFEFVAYTLGYGQLPKAQEDVETDMCVISTVGSFPFEGFDNLA